MKFIYIKKDQCAGISELCHSVSCESELHIQLAIRGYDDEMELDEIKKIAEVGDRILIRFNGKLIPWIIVDKTNDGHLIMNSEDCLEKSKFDDKTNVWRDSYLRNYINSDEFAKKFDPEFIKLTQITDVHTDDYVTKDRFWIPCHEEVNCDAESAKWFKKNKGTKRLKYFTDNQSRIKNFYED